MPKWGLGLGVSDECWAAADTSKLKTRLLSLSVRVFVMCRPWPSARVP